MIYEIAGLRIEINNVYPFTTKFCEKYLSTDQESPVDVTAGVTQEEFEAEKKNSEGFSDGYIENICIYRSICLQLPALERMLLHAAVLEVDGQAYAFLGRSGTGKSTHTGLWMKHIDGCKIVNGDKPILTVREGEIIAHGTPWMGKERRGEKTDAPLKGLCFLRQAKENSIRRLTPAEAASMLFLQILLPSDEAGATKTLELADRLVCDVPAWLLSCDISEEAVRTSFEALTGKTYIENN